MKNQCFGDNRDLFKYDLILQIFAAGLVNRLTYIPMLTRDETGKQGEKKNRQTVKAGGENKRLLSFLDKCVEENRRDIGQLKALFAEKIAIYGEGEYFSHQQRQRYFDQIEDRLLAGSLILVDPDIGLEVARSGEKHLLYAEAKRLFERMDDGSILMIYQHFPRTSQQEYLNMRATELKEKVTGDWPVCVDDGQSIFFFLTKSRSTEESLVSLIGDYTEHYSK